MKKLLYITHLSGKRLNRFWMSSIKAAQELGYEFHLACNMEEAEHPIWDRECEKNGVITHQIYFNRNPLNPGNIQAAKQLTKLLKSEEFDIVHCNTPVGGLIGRICAAKAGVPKVVYQAHGFHFWKGAPLRNWLLYYPVERWLAHKTDVLITINKEDYERAQRFKAKKVVFVPGVGIDMGLFCGCSDGNVQLRKELSIPNDATVLLSVGELIKRKNHRVVIEALPALENVWYVICGQGPLQDEYMELADKLGVGDRVVLAGYRTDVKDFYDMADIFVLPSYQEGLSVALMEAMAMGFPVVSTDCPCGGPKMIIENEINGVLVPVGNTELMASSICRFIEDADFRENCANEAFNVRERFCVENILNQWEDVFSKYVNNIQTVN